MVSIDGRHLLSGSIELHLKTSAWREHGHHLDPRYNDVILHVVVDHGGQETRRRDGGLVAVVAVPAGDVPVRDMDEGKPAWDWSLVGGEVCAATLAREQPSRVGDLLDRLGDERLAGRVAKIEARLSSVPPAEALYLERFGTAWGSR